MHRPAATSHAAEMTVRRGSRGHFSQLPSLRGGGLVGPERAFGPESRKKGNFRGGRVVKTLCFHHKGPGFDPWSEN